MTETTSACAGFTVWLTGLPAAGKSTLACDVRARLAAAGSAAVILDGDEIRRGLSADLGYSPADRSENTRRVAHVAALLGRGGVVALVSMISPFRADREQARRIHVEAGVGFVEVWVATPLAECERRDPKGLYGRARRGDVLGLTGVDSPYEPPVEPEVAIDTSTCTPAEAAERLFRSLPLGR